LLAIAALSATAIMLAIAVATHRFIGRPLALIMRAIEETGSGDGVRHKVDWRSEDELGAVAEAFNEMQTLAEQSETELRSINRKLDALARHDPLTGLPNRRHFGQSLPALASASATHRFALHLIDLDEFKEVNDLMGHGVGDDLLRHVAARIAECVAGEGMVARLGGDEFAALQSRCQDEDDALAFALRLQEAVAQPCRIGKSMAQVKSSIGVALQECRSADLDQVMKMADVALYQAKRSGRGRISLFTREMLAAHDQRRATEAALVAAFARSEFVLHFQPQVRPSDLSIVGLEALVRWRHPSRGLVSPAEFLPTVDEMGLGGQLGALVIAQGCTIARRLWDMGRRDVRVAINLSAEQLSDPELAQQIEARLRKLGLTGQAIELEITEGALIQSPGVAKEALNRLRSLGATVALDDFGTGYSSLSYIRQFPIDRIKIDRSFTRELPEIPRAAAIVRAIRDLAKALDLTLLAEGVESESEAEALVREGVEFAQGYLYGAPAPFETLLARLQTEPARQAS
jgi:diguanylate cyclase (GGDEF)-like protein